MTGYILGINQAIKHLQNTNSQVESGKTRNFTLLDL